jgi:hypothetical protein
MDTETDHSLHYTNLWTVIDFQAAMPESPLTEARKRGARKRGMVEMNVPSDPRRESQIVGSVPAWTAAAEVEIGPAPSAAAGPAGSARPRFHAGRWAWGGGMLAGILFSASLLVAYLIGYHRGDSPRDALLADIMVRAAAAHGGDTMAMATGTVDEQEGLFVLDFLTGELQCYVLNARGPSVFFAHYRTNVINALGVEQGKKPSYAMVTGDVAFLRGAAIARPAGSVVYVCDTNTGNIAVYGIPWNRTAAAAGRPQQGALILLDVAKARNPDIIE